MKTVASVRIAAALTSVCASLAAQGTPTQGEVYYTRFNGGTNLRKVSYDWDGTNFTLGTRQNIAATPGADGLVFAPDQDILVGGQQPNIHKVDPATGTFQTAVVGSLVYHLTLDPGEQKVWGAGLPGSLSEVPLNPFGNGTTHAVTGDDTAVTQIAFVGNDVYYTSSPFSGVGGFGTIDLTTFSTTRLLSNVPAAHGMSVDPATGELFLFGATEIWQLQPDPVNPTVIARLDLSASVSQLDQGAVDGLGHAFIADNGGNLVFLDYSASGRIDDPSTIVQIEFLDTFLDDVAPVAGLGSPCVAAGAWSNYGAGWPGTQGVPRLTSDANPIIGTSLNLTLANSSGSSASGCVAFGLAAATTPTSLGGTVLVDSISAVRSLTVPVAGAVIPLTMPTLVGPNCGFEVFVQGFQMDPGASLGVSFSPGLKLVVGL